MAVKFSFPIFTSMEETHHRKHPVTRLVMIYLLMAAVPAILFLLLIYFKVSGHENAYSTLNSFVSKFLQKNFLIYLVVGFLAQIIDGALGMAYGLTSTSILLSSGVTPVAASASVHMAEVFTTGISGLSHLRFGNVDKAMFRRLAIPAIIGSGLGAYFLTSIHGEIIRPYIAIYLLVMGVIVIIKSRKKVILFKKAKNYSLLAFLGGFLDASGGGGWGPVVTTTLIGSGSHPKFTIGTVNALEFFVTLVSSGIFVGLIGIDSWLIVAGLVVGGVLAAPIGAYITHHINTRIAMILVGLLIIFLSLRSILISFSLI